MLASIQLERLDEVISSTAAKLKVPVTMIRFMIGLLASYPLAAVFKALPSRLHSLKHTMSLCSGLMLLHYVYGVDWIHGIFTSIVTYMISWLAPRKYVHIYVFIFAMGYLTISHLYRVVFFYMVDQFDFTRTQMVLTMKLTSFAFNLYDGRNDNENSCNKYQENQCDGSNGVCIHSNKINSKTTYSYGSKYNQRIEAVRAKYAIDHLPSLLEFGGYVFCFPNLLAGPAFSFRDYMTAIDPSSVKHRGPVDPYPNPKQRGLMASKQQGNQESCGNENMNGIRHRLDGIDSNTSYNNSIDVIKGNEGLTNSEQPSSFLPALARLLLGLGCLSVYFFIVAKAPITRQYDKEWQQSHSFLYRLIFISISFFGERFKFYFAWKLSEGACIMGGFGYQEEVEGLQRDGLQGEGLSKSLTGRIISVYNSSRRYIVMWGGVENIDIFSYETGTNIQSLSRAWNKRTQVWLESYVYQRTNRSLLLTYIVSAVWHGLYPGFLLFFLSAALMSSVERLVRVKVNPLIIVDPSSPSTPFSRSTGGKIMRGVYYVVCWCLTSITLTYHAQTFYMRSWERSFGAFKSFYFIPNIAFIATYLILQMMPTPILPKDHKGVKEDNMKEE